MISWVQLPVQKEKGGGGLRVRKGTEKGMLGSKGASESFRDTVLLKCTLLLGDPQSKDLMDPLPLTTFKPNTGSGLCSHPR